MPYSVQEWTQKTPGTSYGWGFNIGTWPHIGWSDGTRNWQWVCSLQMHALVLTGLEPHSRQTLLSLSHYPPLSAGITGSHNGEWNPQQYCQSLQLLPIPHGCWQSWEEERGFSLPYAFYSPASPFQKQLVRDSGWQGFQTPSPRDGKESRVEPGLHTSQQQLFHWECGTRSVEMTSLSESEPPRITGWKLDGVCNATGWEWPIKVRLGQLGVAGPRLCLSGMVTIGKPSIFIYFLTFN